MHCYRGVLGLQAQQVRTEESIFDDKSCEVVIGPLRRRLGPTSWEILALLRKRKSQPVSVETIRIVVYDGDELTLNNLHAQIFKLRVALEGSPYAIKNHFGIGYQLVKA